MDETRKQEEALFRHSVIGPLLSRPLRRGELKRTLEELASQTWTGPGGETRKLSAKTLETWYYQHRRGGFDSLLPRTRSDRGRLKAIEEPLRELILAMKREDPGRSAPVIRRELEIAGLVRRGNLSVATIQRLLRREGLSGPARELDRPARFRWAASFAGELWQSDVVHGPALFDPASGRPVRVKICSLLDDKTRLVAYARASFRETQTDFLTVLAGAVQRRGAPHGILVDNHPSYRATDTAVACARLDIKLHFARPYDGPSKGKIERFQRTLREHCLDRIDREKVTTLDDLNVRLWAWVEGEYHKTPHEGLSGKTPLAAWEEDASQVRWIDDPAKLDTAFTATIERAVKNDSTVQVRGKTYEVPTHLRGRTVTLGYALLAPECLWVLDGSTRVPVREVDPVANARRPRRRPEDGGGDHAAKKPAPKTGLNAVEAFLKQFIRPVRDASEGGVS
jgi:transposase InsO family protein